MPFDFVAAAGAAYNIYQGVSNSSKGGGAGGSPASTNQGTVYDPFASQRGQYQGQLQNLVQNPSSIYQNPGYIAAQQQTQNQLNSNYAAQGLGNSGALMTASANAANQNALGYLTQQESFLAGLAGASSGFMPSSLGANQSAGAGSALTSGFGSLQSLFNSGAFGSIFGSGGGSNTGVTDMGSANYLGGESGMDMSSIFGG